MYKFSKDMQRCIVVVLYVNLDKAQASKDMILDDKNQSPYPCMLTYVCISMNVWVVAVLELNRNPGHNKGLEHTPCICPKTHPIYHRS